MTQIWRPRRESNPHLRFRKPLFYPLNYGNKYLIDSYLDNIYKFSNFLVAI